MKQQDIDKKIGMPDVDKEWAQFERGVIDQKTTSRKPLYWGIGIAASIALVAGIFLLNHDAEKQQAIAQTDYKYNRNTHSIRQQIGHSCCRRARRFACEG